MKLSLPNTEAIAAAQDQAAVGKAARVLEPSRKRKRQEDHGGDEENAEQPPRKRGAVENSLHITNEAELRKLFAL